MSNYLIFLDLETTGLDPRRDQILEVAAIVVDTETWEESSPLHAVIKHDLSSLHMVDFVRDMHSRTGLLSELEHGRPWSDVQDQLSLLFALYPRARLAGRNVGTFDRAFIEAKAGLITAPLSHQNFDVSTLLNARTWFADFADPLPAFEGTQHRALDDVRNDIEIVRFIADEMGALL